jgi:hypothetical protein
MGASIQISNTPTVEPDSVSKSSGTDVWFKYDLKNDGDEDGTSTGFYWTLDQMDGTIVQSDYVPDDNIPAGGTISQGCKVESTVIGGLESADYWVSLRDGSNSGSTVGAARLTVTD